MSRSKKLVSAKISQNGTMQVEIFPQRLLNVGTAQRLLNELNMIDGIARMVVYGPRLPPDNPDDLLAGKFGRPEKKYLNILGEKVELSVQVGRIWIEITDLAAVEKIRSAAEKRSRSPSSSTKGCTCGERRPSATMSGEARTPTTARWACSIRRIRGAGAAALHRKWTARTITLRAI